MKVTKQTNICKSPDGIDKYVCVKPDGMWETTGQPHTFGYVRFKPTS